MQLSGTGGELIINSWQNRQEINQGMPKKLFQYRIFVSIQFCFKFEVQVFNNTYTISEPQWNTKHHIMLQHDSMKKTHYLACSMVCAYLDPAIGMVKLQLQVGQK